MLKLYMLIDMKNFIIIEGLKEGIHITGIINDKGIHIHVNIDKTGNATVHYYESSELDVVVR